MSLIFVIYFGERSLFIFALVWLVLWVLSRKAGYPYRSYVTNNTLERQRRQSKPVHRAASDCSLFRTRPSFGSYLAPVMISQTVQELSRRHKQTNKQTNTTANNTVSSLHAASFDFFVLSFMPLHDTLKQAVLCFIPLHDTLKQAHESETINFMGQEVQVQGHRMPRLDLEAWRRHQSWPHGSLRLSNWSLNLDETTTSITFTVSISLLINLGMSRVCLEIRLLVFLHCSFSLSSQVCITLCTLPKTS